MVDIARNHDAATPTAAGPTMPPTVPLAVAVPDTAARRTVDDRHHVDVDARHTGRESSAVLPGAESRSAVAARYLLAGIRIALGWVFLWAFLDKLFGLGHATPTARPGSTAAAPPRASSAAPRARSAASSRHRRQRLGRRLFMLRPAGHRRRADRSASAMRFAAIAGALLLVLMWTAVLPPANNPFMDDHLIYAAILIVLALLGAGNTLGFGKAWSATPLVRNATWLK